MPMFNIASYSQMLMTQFRVAGGRIEHREFHDPVEFADTLRSLAEGEIDPSPLLTGVVGIEGVPDAFTVLGHPEGHAKVVVEPGAGPAIVPV